MDTTFSTYPPQLVPARGDISPGLKYLSAPLVNAVISTSTAKNGQRYRLVLSANYIKPGAPSYTPQGFHATERTPKGLQPYKVFLKAKESGDIIFTPYDRGSERVTYRVSLIHVPISIEYNFIVQTLGRNGQWQHYDSCSVRTSDGFFRPYGSGTWRQGVHGILQPTVSVGEGLSTATLDNPASAAVKSSTGVTFRVTPVALTSSSPPSPYYPVSIPDDSLQLQALITRVTERLRVQYDLASELAEARSTVESGKQILSQAINLLTRPKTSSLEMLKSVDDVWLQYRYGIQPIMYSAQDLMEMVTEAQKGRVVKTERGRYSQPLSMTTEPSGTSNCFYEVLDGSRTFRVTGRAVFSSPYGNFTYGTSLNLAAAAWETLRYSFVVDWFTNFGEWLRAQTHHQPRNVVEKFVLSTKDTYTITTYRRETIEGKVERVPVKVREVSTYKRQLIDPGDALPVFLNRFYTDTSWYKTLDAIALSLKPLSSALRKLH